MANLRHLLASTAALLGILALPNLAEARRWSVGGGIHIRAGVRVHVGGYVEEPPPPPPPPVYGYGYGDCACTPASAPAPYYEPAPVQRVWRPTLGIGVFAQSIKLKSTGDEAGVTGATIRLKMGRTVELEGEIGQAEYRDSSRSDLRIGASLYLNLAHRGAWVPFLVLGAGANVIDADQMEDPASQGYLEAGGGLAWRLSDRLTIAGDLRVQSLSLAHDEQGAYHYAVDMGIPDHDRATTARIAGILYF